VLVSHIAVEYFLGANMALTNKTSVRRLGSVAYMEIDGAVDVHLMQAVLGSAPFGVCAVDTQLRYLLINDALAEINGRPAEAHIGNTVVEMVPSIEPEARRVIDRIVATGQPVMNHEFRGETASRPGVPRIWSESWYPIYDDDGGVGAVGVLVEEITEKRNLEAMLRSANAQKDRFIAVLSHELRNFLAPALTAIAVARSAETSVRENMLNVAERNLQQMATLLNDLLDVSRVGRGMLHLDRAPISLTQFVQNASASPLLMATSKGVAFNVHTDTPPILVEVDQARLNQALCNVLLNAVRYTPPGGVITVTAGRDSDDAVIEVRDSGRGIAAEDLATIFEPFYSTADGADGDGGMGIGLTLAKGIVEAHGGTLKATSEGLGLGAIFTIRLPCLTTAA